MEFADVKLGVDRNPRIRGHVSGLFTWLFRKRHPVHNTNRTEAARHQRFSGNVGFIRLENHQVHQLASLDVRPKRELRAYFEIYKKTLNSTNGKQIITSITSTASFTTTTYNNKLEHLQVTSLLFYV
jgi:hypothetical protein